MLTLRKILHRRARVALRKRMAISQANTGDTLRLRDGYAKFAVEAFLNQGSLVNNIICPEVPRRFRDGEEEAAEEGAKSSIRASSHHLPSLAARSTCGRRVG
jgi:hypothetical protein